MTSGGATDDDFRYGVDLFDAGFWWEAHEAWEAHWHDRSDQRRRAIAQALIVLAAACIKREVGNSSASRRLATRSRELVLAVASSDPAYLELDLAAIARVIETELLGEGAASGPFTLPRRSG